MISNEQKPRGTLIFSIYKGWAEFVWVNIFNFNILGVLTKNDCSWELEIFVNNFSGSLLILTILWVIS